MLRGLGDVHADALVFVIPGFGEAGIEVFTGYDDDAAFFEALVEFFGGDFEGAEPDPEEEATFGFVDADVEVIEYITHDA